MRGAGIPGTPTSAVSCIEVRGYLRPGTEPAAWGELGADLQRAVAEDAVSGEEAERFEAQFRARLEAGEFFNAGQGDRRDPHVGIADRRALRFQVRAESAVFPGGVGIEWQDRKVGRHGPLNALNEPA